MTKDEITVAVISAILTGPLTLLIGFWLGGLRARSRDRRTDLNSIAERYIEAIEGNPYGSDGFRMWALYTSGGAGLESHSDMDYVISRIRSRGQPNPIGETWRCFDVIQVFQWATENEIDFRDELATYESFLLAYLEDRPDLDNIENLSTHS